MSLKLTRLSTAAALVTLLAAALAVSPPAGAADEKMKQIESRGELRVCHAEDVPWTFRDPATGEWQGYTRDLAAELAAELGVKLVDVDSTWKTLVPSVQNDECDLGGGGMFATVTRAKVILFTDPFAYATSTAVVHKDSGITSYEQLDQPGKLIIAKAGSATLEFAKRFFKKATVKDFVSDVDAILVAEVANGRADGYWSTSTKGDKLLKENPQFPVRLIGDVPKDFVAVSWGVKEGEYHFQQLVNVWLARHIESGKIAALWEKWFESEFVYKD